MKLSGKMVRFLQGLWNSARFSPAVFGWTLLAKLHPCACFHRGKQAAILAVLQKQFGAFLQQEAEKLQADSAAETHSIGNAPVWVLWLQGYEAAPPLVQTCIDSIRRQAGARPVILLTQQNVEKYAQLPPSMQELWLQKKLSVQQYSDYLRSYLLAHYGGLWLDATVYCAASLEQPDWAERCWHTCKMQEPDDTHAYISAYRWSVFCMAAAKGGQIPRFLCDFFAEYYRRYDRPIDYLLIDFAIELGYRNVESIRRMVDELPQNNPQLYALAGVLNAPYDEQQWQQMCWDTQFFKLNHRCVLKQSADTYFAVLSGR